MNRAIVVVFAFLLISPLVPVSAQPGPAGQDGDIGITLERGMCFGTCPVYSVSLYGNGTIVWRGEMYVAVTGNATDSIDPAKVKDLYDRLIAGGFLKMNDTYDLHRITDMPTATLTVWNGTDVKRVYHYYGDTTAPANLEFMEDAVDTVANTSRWIGTYTPDEGTWGEEI
jgi:hypothetical protein